MGRIEFKHLPSSRTPTYLNIPIIQNRKVHSYVLLRVSAILNWINQLFTLKLILPSGLLQSSNEQVGDSET